MLWYSAQKHTMITVWHHCSHQRWEEDYNNWGENMTQTQYDHMSEAAAAQWAGTLDKWTRQEMHMHFWQYEYLSLYVQMDT